jgi:hypothetical protein
MGRNKLNPAHSGAPKKNDLPFLLTEGTKVNVPPLPPLKASAKDCLGDETEFTKNTPHSARPTCWSPCDDI